MNRTSSSLRFVIAEVGGFADGWRVGAKGEAG